MKSLILLVLFTTIFISSCAPTPTPYVSQVDPCDPDILTAIASSGAIPRCEKIPTPPQNKGISDKEKEEKVTSFLILLASDTSNTSSPNLVEKYINNIRVSIKNNSLFFNVDPSPESGEEAVALAADLILAGTLISDAGKSGDWKLDAIDVFYPLESETCGLELYVKNNNNIVQIAQGTVSVYDVMESYLCEGEDSSLPNSAENNLPFCKDISNLAGNYVKCILPIAYCTYQSTASGKPTFCNDENYPNHNFTLVVWGEDWSDYDGKCIIINGTVSIYQGKPQIEAFGRSQISSCP